MVKSMTPKELAEKTIKDLKKRKEKSSNEFYAYQMEQSFKNRKKWSVRVGGYRW